MITVENLTKSFTAEGTKVLALDSVNLDVQPGAIYGVFGRAASGKSTLARVVAGAERPDSGTVRVDGTDLRAFAGRGQRTPQRQVAVVPDQAALLRQRTTAGNIALPLEQAGIDGPNRKRKVAELLDLAGLTERAGSSLDELSPGQRQRVAIARALSVRPSVLVADEPDPGPDVLTVLDRARAEYGTTVLLLTSQAAAVRRVCDDVALLDAGKLLGEGNLLALAQNPDSPLADVVLPEVVRPRGVTKAYDQVAEIVLVGFAAVGALLPEAATRFDVSVSTIGGGLTRFADTPVARFLLGVDGERAAQALGWIAEQGGVVRAGVGGPQCVAA